MYGLDALLLQKYRIILIGSMKCLNFDNAKNIYYEDRSVLLSQ